MSDQQSTQQTQPEPIPDTIEASTVIQAPVDRVWQLISEPGWWINAGTIREHTLAPDPARPGTTVVTDPEYGDFTLETVAEDAPRTVTYRWRGGAGHAGRTVVRTEITFTVGPAGEGTELRVVESGWASVPPSEEVAAEYRENTEGWEAELAAAKAHLERA